MHKRFPWFVAIIICGCLSACLSKVPLALAEEPPPEDGVVVAAPAAGVDAEATLLRAGQTLVLKIREVIPADDLSPGDRILNSRPPLMAGDRFIAEIMQGGVPSGMYLGGTIARIHPPQMFRRPGHLEIKLVQLVQADDGNNASRALPFDLKDRRWSTTCKRQMVDLFFGFEGAGIGAAIGAQLSQDSPTFIGGGAGIGLLAGLGYAAVQHGPDASLQPGDTFQVVVGKCAYRPLSPTPHMTIYAPDLPPRK